MPLLRFDDPLPIRPRKIAVAGPAGSGKSSLARALGVPYVDIDSLFHGPNWTVRETWIDDVKQVVSGPEWVIEWQGDEVRDQIGANAELLVWLDHPRWLTMYRVIKRTLHRRITKTELWSGNTEGPLRDVFKDPDHIVKLSWRMYPKIRQQVIEVLREKRFPHLVVVRLRGQCQVDAWLKAGWPGSPANP
ncbi:adenylate kinase [Kibdelosporangium philippinense]|uniref:Adenylate kinase n=1 Tax=Kibdelosporangium philippinense TaxID=211113 RepID=A0ABS8Z8V9_9PSEU|nr:adenylate kinase [Kibdelosporangium philippinense]MCE7004311.1 adenylate kinase [Kibdelosporangium philippinense]